MTDGGALYRGTVSHRRLRPRPHRFDYRLFALLLDIDRLDQTAERLRLFSRGGFNLLSVRDRDYGDGSGRSLRVQAEDDCRAIGIASLGRIDLFTLPRLLGFAFNPLSLFFCHAPDGRLAAIIHEVHNTFGERHRYVLGVDVEARQGAGVRQAASKSFHVSPFLPMDLAYDFKVSGVGEDELGVTITASDSQGPILVAVQRMRRARLSDGAILRAVAAMPLMTIKVVAAILWEAARLWAKGVAVQRHPGRRRFGRTLGRAPRPANRKRAA